MTRSSLKRLASTPCRIALSIYLLISVLLLQCVGDTNAFTSKAFLFSPYLTSTRGHLATMLAKPKQPISKEMPLKLDKRRSKAPTVPITPEFSRRISAAKVPSKRPVMCKLLAKESERVALSQRLDIPEILYLSANLTLSRNDPITILVEGKLEARIKAGEFLDPEVIISDFDTVVLDDSSGTAGMSLEDALDYDDEVVNGEIDLGEIVTQYLSLEQF